MCVHLSQPVAGVFLRCVYSELWCPALGRVHNHRRKSRTHPLTRTDLLSLKRVKRISISITHAFASSTQIKMRQPLSCLSTLQQPRDLTGRRARLAPCSRRARPSGCRVAAGWARASPSPRTAASPCPIVRPECVSSRLADGLLVWGSSPGSAYMKLIKPIWLLGRTWFSRSIPIETLSSTPARRTAAAATSARTLARRAGCARRGGAGMLECWGRLRSWVGAGRVLSRPSVVVGPTGGDWSVPVEGGTGESGRSLVMPWAGLSDEGGSEAQM